MASSKLKVAALTIALAVLGVLVQPTALAQAPAPQGVAKPVDFVGPPAPDEKPARVDLFGDVLPDGALARLGTLRWRHGANVFFTAYSQDDKELITASQDGFMRVWEVATGKELRKFGKGQQQNLNQFNGLVPGGNAQAVMIMPINMLTSAAISNDRKVLATSSQDGTIALWNVTEGKEIRTWKPNPQIYVAGLIFAPDDKSLVAKSNDPILRQYDVTNGKEIRKYGQQPNGAQVFFGGQQASLAFTPDGKTLLSGAMVFENNMVAGLIKRFEVETGKELPVIKGPQNGFQAMALSPDGKALAWSGNDGILRLWDIEANKEKHQLGNAQSGGYASALTFAPDGKTMVTRSYDQIIRVWDTGTGKELRQLGGQEVQNANGVVVRVWGGGNGVSNLAYSTDGKQVAAGTGGNTVRQWDVTTGKELEQSAGHHGPVVTLGISPDGKTIATRAGDNTVHLWDVASGKETKSFTLPNGVGHAVFSADGQTMALGSYDGTLRTLDVKAGKVIKEWKAAQNPNPQFGGVVGLVSIALSPDGKMVAARTYDQMIRTFNAATGKELRAMTEAPQTNPNGPAFAVVANFGQPGPMAFSPDGTILASMTGGQQFFSRRAAMAQMVGGGLTLWDVATGKQVRRLDTANRQIATLAFAPDGRTLATGNFDNTITLWEAVTGKERFNFKSNTTGSITVLTYSPDGRTLIGSGQDQLIRCYSTRSGKELTQFKGHQGAVVALALAADGKTLVSGSVDTTGLVWDVSSANKEEKPAEVDLEATKTAALFNDLGADDAKKAGAAIRTLDTAPKQAVPLLQEHIKPVAAPDPEKVKQLIADLEGDKPFIVRQKANDELEKLGELATDALQKVLADKPGLEMQMRIERLLERLVTGQAPPPDLVRAIRALEVLEHLGTSEARQTIESIAKGAPGARLTREAQTALNRIPK